MSYAASAPSPDEPRGAEVSARLTRVLIATDALDASRAILEELRHLELDVQLCLFQGGKLSEIPLRAPDAVLCHFTLDNRSGVKVATVLKAHFEMRQPPIIGVLPDVSEPSPSVFDSQLFAPVHPSQIANRVNAMIRLGAMEGEIQRRLKTRPPS